MDKALFLNLVLCVVGLALHFSTKWMEHRRDVAPIGFKLFVANRPAISIVSVLSTIAAFLGTYALDWMNPGMAFACGYVGNSVAVKMVKGYIQ